MRAPDDDVRLHLYERFVAEGRPPGAHETARALGLGEREAEDAYRRLADEHVLVLAPGTTDVVMAAPLSAAPTPFRVESERGSFYGNCIWDGLGAVAMLGRSGRVETSCPDCGEPLVFTVSEGELEHVDAVVHYAVPAARWWDDIAFS
ncbi:MAG TPA: organomercurial lyase [Gaiellaceae bacterium]|nr:organomercurial lyase [Gaiellaceae bacterium]